MAKGLDLANFQKSNVGTTILVGVLLLVLVFLPEIIGFRGTADRSPDEITIAPLETVPFAPERQPPIERVVAPPSVDTESRPLAQLSRRLEQEGLDAVAGEPARPEIEELVALYFPEMPRSVSQTGELSWPVVKTAPVRKSLNKAAQDARSLARKVSAPTDPVPVALEQFARVAQRLTQKDIERKMRLEDGLRLLEHFDLLVTRALLAEEMPRYFLARWAEVEVDARIQSVRALHWKRTVVPPFSPNVRLNSVNIRQTRVPGQQRFDPKRRVKGSFEIYMEGADIDNVALFLDGRLEHQRLGVRRVKGTDLRRSRARINNFRSAVTLVISDKFGNHHLQNYNFTRPIGTLGWRISQSPYHFAPIVPFRTDMANPTMEQFFRGDSAASIVLAGMPQVTEPAVRWSTF